VLRVTEPNTGLKHAAADDDGVRDGDHYVVRGQKVWISTAQVAHKILLLTRTTPIEQLARPSDGLTLFYTDLDRSRVEVREIDKHGRACVDSNQLSSTALRIPITDRHRRGGQGLLVHLAGFTPSAC